MQVVHPSLAAAASRLTGEQFSDLSASVAAGVTHAGYAKLTMILAGHGIEPLPEVVSQICIGRRFFLGKYLPDNLMNALTRLPQTYGNEMIDAAESAQDLVNLCGPYFRGNFSLLLSRLNEMNTRPGDEAGLLSFNLGPSSDELAQALDLEQGLEFLTSAFHCFPLVPTRDFGIRRLAHAVGNNPLTSMAVWEMRDIFFRGFTCGNESIRRSFLLLAPALCADPSVEEGVKIGCLVAARNAMRDDPSPAIRQAAAGVLQQLP
jgi:hypothetical protein